MFSNICKPVVFNMFTYTNFYAQSNRNNQQQQQQLRIQNTENKTNQNCNTSKIPQSLFLQIGR